MHLEIIFKIFLELDVAPSERKNSLSYLTSCYPLPVTEILNGDD
jgi:hypothetical protein